jgi:3-hydroxyacyl-[acyl-carrier-protein] dehydratase
MSTAKSDHTALRLGSNVIELLLPQRRPMVMVDQITAYSTSPRFTLYASKEISSNEIFFEGHFPGLHLWPGCLTIEGMGQTSALLITLQNICSGFEQHGGTAEDAFDALRNLEMGYRMHPGFKADDAERFLAQLRLAGKIMAVGAAVDVKLLRPVFPGQRLDYRATTAGEFGDMMRFEVEAMVGGDTVARGSMTGARLHRPPLLTPDSAKVLTE